MKKLIVAIFCTACITFALAYFLKKGDEPKVDYNPIIDSIIAVDKERIKQDSIRHQSTIDSLNNRIKTINYLRKNERNKYESELSKINKIVDSSDYIRYNDSILKMLRSNNSN